MPGIEPRITTPRSDLTYRQLKPHTNVTPNLMRGENRLLSMMFKYNL